MILFLALSRKRRFGQPSGQSFPENHLDRYANALLDGAREEDGGGSGIALTSTADGSCFFNAVATAAWGADHEHPGDTDGLALPLRLAVVLAGVRQLNRLGDESNSFRKRDVFDSMVTDKASKTRLTMATVRGEEGIYTEDVARALLLLALSTITGEFDEGSIICIHLVPEVLRVTLRVYYPGETTP